ncbi:MAG: metal-sulfur cluster assembly factor [Patescibacteria group bacterium]
MATKEQVLKKLQDVVDPELGISIVELGLIYDVKTKDGNVEILMTLTTPFCPLYSIIKEKIENALKKIDGVNKVSTELSFDPPWSLDRISPEGKLKLGLLS